jgi:hypothetical protein
VLRKPLWLVLTVLRSSPDARKRLAEAAGPLSVALRLQYGGFLFMKNFGGVAEGNVLLPKSGFHAVCTSCCASISSIFSVTYLVEDVGQGR